ncbi:toxin-antitoxin system HicB family antitoxin [Serratia marcescens]|uniref:toxin-antitoxin system HicB family antitoxin n=1 Tax=Serratia TaxID=613 RepID=UPI00044E526D|nr:toxin-antitoxin system HicB family antitoxin [Serratia marcescens]ELN4405971.1 toxin-antitoxin system HicB family antitoxin [Serratia marcescens]ETX38530.1 hypothetical protein P805_04390 [Serratia marcescens BIDMC 44]HBC0576095.1 toxin-antitoxin system HicB family antitoxin [Serratia marcescens]HBV3812571.1 toxin-antitoxin system HicB family antitoxin [Serratia marcescens]
MRDAEEYTISIRLESIEGERMYVARVEELPDVEEYADTYEFARELILDTIKTTQNIFERKGLTFPEPKIFSLADVSGRVTLRLPKSVHAKCISDSEHEGVSLNTYILTCITSYKAQSTESMTSAIVASINAHFADVHTKSGRSFVGDRVKSMYSVIRHSEISTSKFRVADDDPFIEPSIESSRGFTAPISFSHKVLPC